MAKQQDTTNDIRRKLLKAVVYAPPVILGSMVATPRSVMGAPLLIGTPKTCTTPGGAGIPITVSSGANACCPCVQQSTDFNPAKCAQKRCLYSCGTNCTPAQLAQKSCKDFCVVCSMTPAGCKKPCKKGCAPDPNVPGAGKCL